tara:strand:- start:417 stop:1109 length:693 start_codon:yes stop_codon:yes gene_type:complete
MSNADELKKLKELLDDKIISQEEFDKEKSKLLGNDTDQPDPSIDEIENDSDSKLNEKTKIKKRYLIAGVFLVLYMIGSVGGETSNTSSSNSSSSSASSSSSNSSSSVCVNWADESLTNLTSFQNYVDLMTDASYDAGYGYISFSEYQSKLENYEIRIKSIRSNQNSNLPNSSNQTAHDYLLEAIDLTLSAISFTIVGVELNDESYIYLAADLQEEAAASMRLFTSNLRDC